jgi:hypothetical protein
MQFKRTKQKNANPIRDKSPFFTEVRGSIVDIDVKSKGRGFAPPSFVRTLHSLTSSVVAIRTHL